VAGLAAHRVERLAEDKFAYLLVFHAFGARWGRFASLAGMMTQPDHAQAYNFSGAGL
jgi:hypothetical protein